MFCSGCGRELRNGAGILPAVWPGGRAARAAGGPAARLSVRIIKLCRQNARARHPWLVWAGLSLMPGFVGLRFLQAFLSGGFGPWAQNQHMFPDWFGSALIHFAMAIIVLRAVVCAVAGWGLLERTQWGRIMAIIAAVSACQNPVGTAIGIASLVILLGYRNSTLYDSL